MSSRQTPASRVPGAPRRRAAVVGSLAAGALLLAGGATWGLRQTGEQARPSESSMASPAPMASAPPEALRARAVAPATVTRVTCPQATVTVRTPNELTSALAAAAPGTVISVADGRYAGQFSGRTAGTADQPIWLCGGAGAVLDGGGTASGYGLHLDGGDHWRVVGLTIRNAQKGVVLDHSSHTVLQGLHVTQIGDEGVHLRRDSSDDVVTDVTVDHTGLKVPKYGEGIYVGTAVSNWCEVSSCRPDASQRNVLAGNHIRDTTAENIDIKEGTIAGQILDNDLSGGSTEESSVVNVKGNAWRVSRNRVADAPKNGFETHQVVPGWGINSVFEANVVTASAGAATEGFAVASDADNQVGCDNSGGAGLGGSKTPCH